MARQSKKPRKLAEDTGIIIKASEPPGGSYMNFDSLLAPSMIKGLAFRDGCRILEEIDNTWIPEKSSGCTKGMKAFLYILLYLECWDYIRIGNLPNTNQDEYFALCVALANLSRFANAEVISPEEINNCIFESRLPIDITWLLNDNKGSCYRSDSVVSNSRVVEFLHLMSILFLSRENYTLETVRADQGDGFDSLLDCCINTCRIVKMKMSEDIEINEMEKLDFDL